MTQPAGFIPDGFEPDPVGLIAPGNVDLTNRPRVKNPDGSISTVRSMSINVDGKEVLIPTVVGNRVVSDDEAIANYRKTGQHLGMFDTPEHATAYAQQLHTDQARDLDAPPNFQASNEKDASGAAVVDPNTLGTFARHVGAQVNPVTAVKAMGQAVMHPIETAKAIGAAQEEPLNRAKASYAQGDVGGAAIHFLNYLLPLIGPVLDKSGTDIREGKYAAGAGDAVGLGLAMFGPQAATGAAAARYPLASHPVAAAASKVGVGPVVGSKLNPAEAAAVEFSEARGVPLDLATKTGSPAARAIQKRVANSMGGEGTAERLIAQQEQALQRVGGELAAEAHPATVTAEQAGQAVRDRLASKAQGYEREATVAYDRLRELEADPSMRVSVPLPSASVDALGETTRGALRQIVHEMDAMPYTKKVLRPGDVGGSMVHAEGTGGAGAKVYHDIVAHLDGGNPTRAQVQNALEEYLAGGKDSPIAKAAREVADLRERGMWAPMVDSSEAYLSARRGRVQRPEMGSLASDTPTRLEAGRVTTQEMGLPTNITAAKEALRPVYEQMKRQMPEAQQQANPGLKAIGNILDAPDWAPLSQVDTDLSAIKKLAREKGGLAKLAVQRLEAAVQEAAALGGDEVVGTLKKGREATIRKVQVEKVVDTLRGGPMEEAVAVQRQLTAPQDSAIKLLRRVKQEAPQQLEQVARGYLEDVLGKATAEGGFDRAAGLMADWQRLGTETKKILFPKDGQRQALDQFFLLAKRMAENPNPSGTAHTLTAMNFASQPVMFGLAKLLYTPWGVRALTKALSVDLKLRALPNVSKGALAARTVALADIAAAARAAGVPLRAPAAAGSDRK